MSYNMFLLGVKDKLYLDKEGKSKRSREVHIMYDRGEEEDDSFRGNRVDTFYVNFDVSSLPLQKWYEPQWNVQKFQGKTEARLIGLVQVEE